MRRTVIAVLTAALAATPVTVGALPRGLEVNTYKAGLNFPVDMAWLKGTRRVFFTEKSTGKIRILNGRHLRDRACANLDVSSDGERGLLGITLHPRFKQNHWLYVYYTNSSPLENRVTRFRVQDGRCRNPLHIVTGITASPAPYHNGGQLEFVGNKLFVSTGDAHEPALAQSRDNRLGKILRYKADGSVPASNPFSNITGNNPVWSYGHRNPFGLTHKPGTKRLYETENGPNCDDELNFIRKGRNYGWGPGYQCGTRGVGTNPKRPLKRWSNIIVPTDPTWYMGRLKKLTNKLYVGSFNSGKLHRFKLSAKGSRVRSHRVIYDGPDGILDVSKGPGGWLYFLTSSGIKRITR